MNENESVFNQHLGAFNTEIFSSWYAVGMAPNFRQVLRGWIKTAVKIRREERIELGKPDKEIYGNF